MRNNVIDTVTELLTRRDLAQEIDYIYGMWRVWQDIVSGAHGCYTEFCRCDQVCAYAKEQGW